MGDETIGYEQVRRNKKFMKIRKIKENGEIKLKEIISTKKSLDVANVKFQGKEIYIRGCSYCWFYRGILHKMEKSRIDERNIIFFITVILGIFFGFFITLQFLSNTYNLYTGKTTQEFFLGRKGSSKRGLANLAIFCPARASLIKY